MGECICGHYRIAHYGDPNPKCTRLVYQADLFGEGWVPCDCPGFEADPKAGA
ncbi:hypothetical protein [Mycobacteroides abscessus]|uniref:hypothetical protein n=1 Tax=Mycobacteroides abscessus TaxID=36809 RepID=UPI0013F5C472|nr:hypothetical protein [Mycobacteroides abscessus]